MVATRFIGAKEVLARYIAVFGAAWKTRRQLENPERLPYELDFLPANLELIEAPVHPAPKWSMRAIVTLTGLSLLIALLGQLDIVISAKGKLLPSARVKIIQPALTGVVKAINVRDGERVKPSQVLMELDTAQASADSDKAREARLDASLTVARASALLEGQATNRPPVVAAVAGASRQQMRQAQEFAEGLYREYEDKLGSAQSELQKRTADLQTTLFEVVKLQATAPLARQEANDYKILSADTYVAKHDYLAKEETAIGQESELRAQQSHVVQLRAGIQQQRSEISALTSQFRREQLDTLTKSSQSVAQDVNDETKTQVRKELLSIKSPVAGTVQQLAMHTIGGVVTSAQTLMIIVPDDSVDVEVNVENKDVGFVEAGQKVILKIEAFPYTRFGYLTGKVESLSSDAVQDKKLGLTFVAHIRLDQNQMRVNDKMVNLTPGLEVSAEINTGRRSVARYFLDPLVQTTQESFHER